MTMALRDAARKNHEQLFPNHVSTVAKTDPELIEIFDNFAFDEVLRHGDIDIRTRLMIQLAALIACQSVNEYRVMAGAALNVGVTPVEIKEILYQAVAYVGMARAFDFIAATNEVLAERGVALPLPAQSTVTAQTRMKKGITVQKEIFGDEAIDAMRANAPADQMHIQDFLADHCFGDHYTRTGLEIRMRELITFCILVAMGGCDNQAAGHVRGNLNVGNDRARLIAALTQLVPFIGYPRTLNGLAAIDKVTAETA